MRRIYIHELAEWSEGYPGAVKFRYDPEGLMLLFSNLKQKQGHLIGRMSSMGFELRQKAELDILTQTVLKTSLIEGEVLDADDVRSSLAGKLGVDIGGAFKKDRHSDGVVDLMLDATTRCIEPLTSKRLFGWHAGLFPNGMNSQGPITVGTYRDGPIQVVSGAYGRKQTIHFDAPEATRVPGEMKRFLDWFNNDKIEFVIKSAMAHLWFVTIHPFDDGNGRIARAIADMLLAASDGFNQRFYSMTAQIQKNTKEYYDILEATQKGDLDISEWLEWYFNQLILSLDMADKTLVQVIAKHDYWIEHSDKQINARQKKMLNKLLDGFEGHMKRSKYCHFNHVSPATAARDIADLVELGMVVDVGGGRGTHYQLPG
jgi:Fic family protein